MSVDEGSAAEEEVRTGRLRYRIAFFLASLVVLGLLVTLPFSAKSVVNPYYQTAVDLALSIVIVFTLGAILVRALIYVHDQAELGLFKRRKRRRP